MNIEIERKFLVDPSKIPLADRTNGQRLAQGYLASKPSVRVRLASDGQAWLTIKGEPAPVIDSADGESIRPPGGQPLGRQEFEYAIPPEDAKRLLALCLHALDKIRYHVKYGDHLWDLDEFVGAHRGFWLAEVELKHPGEQVRLPPWVTDEVTDDLRYTNGALSRAGKAPGASLPAMDRAIALTGDRLSKFEPGARFATFIPLMEAACLTAVADGEVDDDERTVIRRVYFKLSGAAEHPSRAPSSSGSSGSFALPDAVAEAMLASSVERTATEGVTRRVDDLAAALKKHDVVHEGLVLAAIVAEISAGVLPSERAVLDRLALKLGSTAQAMDELIAKVRVALGRES
jgi:adenylate cyclase